MYMIVHVENDSRNYLLSVSEIWWPSKTTRSDVKEEGRTSVRNSENEGSEECSIKNVRPLK